MPYSFLLVYWQRGKRKRKVAISRLFRYEWLLHHFNINPNIVEDDLPLGETLPTSHEGWDQKALRKLVKHGKRCYDQSCTMLRVRGLGLELVVSHQRCLPPSHLFTG